MRTNALLKLHQRQVDLLDMIVRAGNRVNEYKSDLHIIRSNTDRDRKYWNEFINAESVTQGNIFRYTAIKERLIRYYTDIQERINDLQPEKEISPAEADIVTQSLIS